MSDWMKSWGNFLTENKQPIEEASEEEIASLDNILLDLDPKDLSFNNIFGDKTRIAVPLGTEVHEGCVQRCLDVGDDPTIDVAAIEPRLGCRDLVLIERLV